MSGVVLETDRLVLRPFEPEDAESFHRNVNSDPEVMRFLFGVRTPEATRKFVKERARTPKEGQPGLWAITLKDQPEAGVVGFAGFLDQTLEGEQVEELGYRLARRLWGKGIATEAAIAARDWFFEHTDQDHFFGFIVPENKPSIATAERIGLTYLKDAVVKGVEVRVYVSPTYVG